MNEHIQLMVGRLANQRDAEIKRTLDDVLGAGQWTMDGVKPRLAWGGFKGQWLFLDDRPLLAFEPVVEEVDWINPPGPPTVDAALKVSRFDWKAA